MQIKNILISTLIIGLTFGACTGSSSDTNSDNTATNSNNNSKNAPVDEKAKFLKEKAKARTKTKIITNDSEENLGYTRAQKKLKAKNDVLARTKNKTTYKIDNKRSRVNFVGRKLNGKHSGFFPINNGKLISDKNGNLIGGNFSIDISKVTITDLKGNSKKQLEDHLKSADFFDVKNNRFANFEIINIEKKEYERKLQFKNFSYIVEGNLQMNGITKSITFPLTFKGNKEGMSKGRARLKIDRTQWGLHYGNDKSLKDKFIKPQVELTIDIGGLIQ